MITRLPLSRVAHGAVAVAGAVALMASAGCSKRADKAAERASGKPGDLRCADFISKAEAEAMGLKIERYGVTAADDAMQVVNCSLGGVTAVIWRGDQYASMIAGIKANGLSNGVETEDGPKIGGDSQWTTMPDVHGHDGKVPHTVNFSPPSKKFTAAVSGTDRDKIEQVARALLARFEAP